jgi:hypothetical protein
MSFVAAFLTTQTQGVPASVNFKDVSTGSDTNIVSRAIYIQTSSGSFLVTSGVSTQFNVWALNVNPITLSNILTSDTAAIVTVQWLDINGNVLYVSVQVVGYTLKGETFDYYTTQKMAGNPALINDNSWFENKSLIRLFIDSGNQAISFASDTFNAQLCYNAENELILNKRQYFNINS